MSAVSLQLSKTVAALQFSLTASVRGNCNHFVGSTVCIATYCCYVRAVPVYFSEHCSKAHCKLRLEVCILKRHAVAIASLAQFLCHCSRSHQDCHSCELLQTLTLWTCRCAYVYERLTPKGKAPSFSSLILTQLVSSVWHGFFPGYVLFFSSAIIFQLSKVLYRYERKWPAEIRRFPLWTLAK